jgi:PKHD-type hydroxylase
VIQWATKKGFARDILSKSKHVIRRTKVAVFTPSTRDRRISWFGHKLLGIVATLNKQIWRFDITHLSEVYVLRYYKGDQVALHGDLMVGSCDRKIGVLVQLSRPEAYEGGELEYGTPPMAASRERGGLLVFPAWMPHRVTPVTAGTRYSAACFALGPPFR